MKICHIIHDLSRGGAESHLYSIVKLQSEAGHTVSVMLLGRDLKNFYSLEKDFRQLDIEIIRFQGPKDLKGFNPFSIIAAIRYFSKNKFDIVHSHSPRSDFLSFVSHIFLSKKNKRIVTVHGKYGTYLDGNKFMDILRSYAILILARTWHKADAVIVISESIEDWIVELNKKIRPTVIPYGIPIPDKKTKRDSENITIGFLGRLNQNKGIEDLIYSFLDTKRNNPELKRDLKLNIGGVGTKSFERKLARISKGDDVNFLGYVSDRKDFFHSIDLFVFPSYSEGLGLVLLEAMSYGVPCLTRDISPMNKIVNDRENGYLFSDSNELSGVLSFVLKIDEAEKDLIINNAITTIENSYSIIQMYSRIEDIYNT